MEFVRISRTIKYVWGSVVGRGTG